MHTTFAVTGATGAVGGRVARQLAKHGAKQRLVVRDASKAPGLPWSDAVSAEYGDGEAMRRALDGTQVLFMVSGREHPDRIQQHLTVVDAAAAAGIERIVYLSFLGAAADATFTFARHHWVTEQHIAEVGLPATCLRDNLYIDFFPYFAGADGVIRGPANDGRVGAVARDDVADVAVAALLDEGHAGKTYDVTGSEALTMADAAETLSRFAGREVTFVNETMEEAYASRAHYGAPDWEVEGWVTTYAAVAAGELDVVADTVERVTGHAPMTLEDFLRDNPESYQHLLAR